MTTTSTPSPVEKIAAGTADYLDQRTGIGTAVKVFARKIFPDHWSFLLGEIALYSFVTILISGVFLTLFFVPSMNEVVYDGPWVALQGQHMSEAFASTLKLSFEVRGGLLMRQIHHWAALIFMASIVTHMMRVFFTGAFRKPREVNWVVGFTLMILGLAAGFTGYSLPDDVLSGNGLRITDGVVRAIPIIGSYTSYFLFGGEFPGDVLIPRMFTVHILLIPGIILALIGLHLFFVVLHKHTQYPGSGRTNKNVVGYPLFPIYVAKAGGYFFLVFGVIALMAATMSINPVWNYGPFDPAIVSAGAQPDWYMLFLEGSLRLMPGFAEVVIGQYTLSLNVIIPAMVVPGILFTALALYPFIEAFATGDHKEHHVLDRPRNRPFRTAFGVSLLTAFFILILAGSNDLIATHFHLSINDITLGVPGPDLPRPVVRVLDHQAHLPRPAAQGPRAGPARSRDRSHRAVRQRRVHRGAQAAQPARAVAARAARQHPPARDRAGGGLARCPSQGLPARPHAAAALGDVLRGPHRARHPRRAGRGALAR